MLVVLVVGGGAPQGQEDSWSWTAEQEPPGQKKTIMEPFWKQKNNYWTILRKWTIMEPFWEKTTIEPFWEKNQLWNHFEEEKMQLLNPFEERAIMEQFQKKKIIVPFWEKKAIMEPFSGKQLTLRKGKSCSYWWHWRTCSELGSLFQLQWEIVAKSTPPSFPEITILHRFGPNINTQNRTTRICRFCLRGWILRKRPTFGHVIIFWWRCSVHL